MSKPPRPGDPAPDFEAPDQDGKPHRLRDYRGAWLALYFYPADDTPGCTRQACAFRDRYERLTAAGIHVLGVSRNAADAHKAFAAAHQLPFPLLADRERRVIRAYGAEGFLGLPRRITFLIDPDGVVRLAHDSHFRMAGHVEAVLDAHARLTAEVPS